MRKFEDRYWIETDSSVNSSQSTNSGTTSGIKGTSQLYAHATQNPHNPSPSRFEVFPNAQTFC